MALRMADGVVLVVDAVDGVMAHTERILRQIVQEGLPFTLIINKMDRLVLELKLPPADAYFKLRHTVEEINAFVSGLTPEWERFRVSPELGNVCFASSLYGFVFSARSFAKHYAGLWGKFCFFLLSCLLVMTRFCSTLARRRRGRG